MLKSLIKTLVKAWDPEFIKVTAKEKKLLNDADSEMMMGEYVSEEDFWT